MTQLRANSEDEIVAVVKVITSRHSFILNTTKSRVVCCICKLKNVSRVATAANAKLRKVSFLLNSECLQHVFKNEDKKKRSEK